MDNAVYRTAFFADVVNQLVVEADGAVFGHGSNQSDMHSLKNVLDESDGDLRGDVCFFIAVERCCFNSSRLVEIPSNRSFRRIVCCLKKIERAVLPSCLPDRTALS